MVSTPLVGLYVADSLGFEKWLENERTRLRRRVAEAARALSAAEEGAGRPDPCGEGGAPGHAIASLR